MSLGYAEFNDSSSKLRGILVAGEGTFSGNFSAQNINAISHINIRDGAVSAHLGFSFPSSARSIAFAVPGVPEASVADISVPLSVWCYGFTTGFVNVGNISLYKNGQLLHSHGLALQRRAGIPQALRFIDPDVLGVSNYQVRIESNTQYGYISFLGTVTVGFRKR